MRSKKSATIIDAYKLFREANKDIDYNTYKSVLEQFNKTLMDDLLLNSNIIKLPYGLGYVSIVKYKPKTMTEKSLSVDYKASKEYGKRIYHLNEHSDGYKYRLYWSKVPKTFPDRYRYQLCLVRNNKRKLAQLIFNKQDYINANDIQIYKM